MENKLLKLDLQLFAGEESAGGAAAAGGTGSADAGSAQPIAQDAGGQAEGVNALPQREGSRQRIFPRVPKVETHPVQPAAKPARPIPTAQTQQQPAQAAPEMTWADAKKRFANEYGADVRAAVNERFKNREDESNRLNDALDTLASIAPFYGVNADDPARMDLAKLKDSIRNDKRWYEKAALENGVPVETEMRVQQLEMEKKRREMETRRSLEKEMLNRHIAGLREQEAELKKEFPDFDLSTEVQNRAFARMTAPGGGMSLRQAYFALHGDELMQRQSKSTEEKTKQTMSRAIQAGSVRPAENGMTGDGGGIPNKDYSRMTREEWAEIRNRARRGEKIAIV